MHRIGVSLLVGILSIGAVSAAHADTIELGTTMAGVTFASEGTTVGVPSSGFGFSTPGVFASFFVTPHVSLEPQATFVVVSSSGDSYHAVHGAGQGNYFLSGPDRSSPYLFGTGGIIHVSGSDISPKLIGAGAGYRVRVGDRLTFRFDGRALHMTDEGGNMLTLGVSIGGLFGRR